MALNKEDLFKDFLANKQKKSEERQKKINEEMKKDTAVVNNENEKTEVKQNNNTNNRYRKNKTKKNEPPKFEQKKLFEIEKTNVDPYKTEEFLKFKEEFLSNTTVKGFMQNLDLYREREFVMFDNNDFFIKAKMEHPNCRAIIVEPSLYDITSGKSGNVYIVKPMYQKEYIEFQKSYGDRINFHEEFITYCILKCLLYPQNITESDIEKISAGTIITLYSTINNLSDFNKQFTVVEV